MSQTWTRLQKIQSLQFNIYLLIILKTQTTAQLLWYTTQGKETVTTYKIRIDTKCQKGTEWKIYGRKSAVKMQKTHWGGGGGGEEKKKKKKKKWGGLVK